MIDWRVVPIQKWPGENTRARKRSPFDATWMQTTSLLERELKQLRARQIVLQMAVTDDDIRQDGWIRATARPAHPGVILSMDSRYGPLSYPCDTFHDWQDNVRAIALALEALRKVDRYGVTKRGEQYTGWKALPPGDNTKSTDLIRRGLAIIEKHGSATAALFATHPDHGGDVEDFRAVQAARGRDA